MIALLITLVLFPLAGSIAGRRPFSEAFLFGVGIVGASLFVGGVLNIPFEVTLALVVIAGITGALRSAFGARASQPAVVGPPGPTTKNTTTATLLTIAPLLILTFVAATLPLNDYDGRVFWLLKAKALAHDRSIDGPFFQGQEVYSPRNQYPLLLPLDAATIMTLRRDADDQQVRFLYLGIFIALVFEVRRRVGPWTAVLLAWIPQFAVAGEGGALSAYCDVAVAAFVACAFFELIDGERPAVFGCWLAFLTLTKSEGLPLSLILAAVGAWTFRRRIGVALVPLAVAAVSLIVWRSGIPHTDEEPFLERLPLLPQSFGRLLPALGGIARHAFTVEVWGFFWIAAVIAVVILATRREWRPAVTIGAVLAMYVAVYMVSVWILRDLIDSSVDRLLMHLAGPALFAIGRMPANGFERSQ